MWHEQISEAMLAFLCMIYHVSDLPLDSHLPIVTLAYVLELISWFLIWYLSAWLWTNIRLYPDCFCLMYLYLTVWLLMTLACILTFSVPSDSVLICPDVGNLWFVSWLCSSPLRCSCLWSLHGGSQLSVSWIEQLALPRTINPVPLCVFTSPIATTRSIAQEIQKKYLFSSIFIMYMTARR